MIVRSAGFFATALPLLVLLDTSAVNGFVVPKSTVGSSISSTQLHEVGAPTGYDIPEDYDQDPASVRSLTEMTNVPYGEMSRKYRRTVYTYDDWKKHRSQDRFIYYLLAFFTSGVYKNLAREVYAVTFVATFLVVWNALADGYTDLEGVKHAAVMANLPKLVLPLNTFTVTSPSLGLLLGMYWISHILYICTYSINRRAHLWLTFHADIICLHHSLPHQHLVQSVGRGSEELGDEHQSHERSCSHGQLLLRHSRRNPGETCR